MSIIAEALKKAQRKKKKGGDVPPPFDLGKGKQPQEAGAAKQTAAPPKAKPLSRTPQAKPAAKASPRSAPRAKSAPKTAKAAKPAKPAGGEKLWQQRRVRVAAIFVGVLVVFAAGMDYVNTVYLPGINEGGITADSGARPAAAPSPAADATDEQAQADQAAADGELAVTEDGIEVPPVPDEGIGQVETEISDSGPLPELAEREQSNGAEAQATGAAAGETAQPLAPLEPPMASQAQTGTGVPAQSPPADNNPGTIVHKGEQEKQMREDIYHFNMAVYFQRKGDVREALSEYEEVIRLSPHNAEVFSNMGVLYNDVGEYEEAVGVLQKALLIDPNYSKARNNLAVAYYRSGQFDLALEQASRAVELSPGNIDAFNNMGLIYRKMGNVDQAEHSFRKALAIDPGYPAAHYNLALLYEQTGQLTQASRHYRSFLDGGGGSEQLNNRVLNRVRELTPGMSATRN